MRLRLCDGVQIIGLELFRRDTFQKKRNQSHVVSLRQFGVQRFEAGGIVRAVIGWQLHAQQQYLSVCLARLLDKGSEVGFDVRDGCAAQAVIGAEFEDNDAGVVLAKCRGYALASACSGFATDAGIDYLILRMAALELLLQQVHPARFARDTIGCRQAVAEYQYRLLCGARYCRLRETGSRQQATGTQ